jgi:hypothetical protein
MCEIVFELQGAETENISETNKSGECGVFGYQEVVRGSAALERL